MKIDENAFSLSDQLSVQAIHYDSSDTLRYEIIINNTLEDITNFKALAIPRGIEMDSDMVYPNINLVEEVDLSTFYTKQQAIRMIMLSVQDITSFTLYYMYTNHQGEDIFN